MNYIKTPIKQREYTALPVSAPRKTYIEIVRPDYSVRRLKLAVDFKHWEIATGALSGAVIVLYVVAFLV